MYKHISGLALGTLILSGCSAFSQQNYSESVDAPLEKSSQPSMQVAQHWDILAKHQAEMIEEYTEFRYPLYVQHNNSGSPFDSTFAEMLASYLVQQGASVRTSPDFAALVTYKVDYIPANSEVAITTRVTYKDHLLYSGTSTYFTPSRARPHYTNTGPNGEIPPRPLTPEERARQRVSVTNEL